MKIFSIFSIFILFFIYGCNRVSPSPVTSKTIKKVAVPEWVNGVAPNNTKTKMYGIGNGKDRRDAINNALENMLSTLGISIESSLQSFEKSEHSYVVSKTISNIKTNISKTKINNYKVIKSYKISYNEFAVIVECDKVKFVEGLKSSLNEKKRLILQKLNSLAGENIIVRYNAKKQLANKSKNLLSSIFMIAELDNTFNKKLNLHFIENIQQSFIDESNKLKFYVYGDKNSTQFVRKLKNLLSQKNFKISNIKNNAVNIKILTKKEISKGNIPIAIFKIDISAMNQKHLIGGRTILIKERYKTNSATYRKAAIHFEQNLKNKQNLFKAIGIDLVL